MIVFLLVFSVIISITSKTFAISRQIFITVRINGNIIAMNTLPYIKDNRTMVSLRFVAEALNCDVEWIGEERA